MPHPPSVPADRPDETVKSDAPAQDRDPKVAHDPDGGRSAVNQRKQGAVHDGAAAPDEPN